MTVVPLLAFSLASCLLLALLATPSGGSAPGRTCTATQKTANQNAVRAYRAKMQVARNAYFKTHKGASLRTAFVKMQLAELARLQRTADCEISQPAPTTTADTGPVAAPAPGANETFSFGSEMTAAAQDEIRGDVSYAMQDEAALLGVPIASIAAFASTSPDWLADQECRFVGQNDDSCRQSVRQRWASGNYTAVGGHGGIFLYWASSSWQHGAGVNQKIIAHELFHNFQYQLHHLVDNDATPSSQVRASGPVWLDEGAPEMVGYRVAADRRLFPSYASALSEQIGSAKGITAPLSSLETYSQAQISGVYSLFHVAADHLVGIAAAGVPALTTYLKAIGAGSAWQDAFRTAFGLSVDAYYANFATYRAGL